MVIVDVMDDLQDRYSDSAEVTEGKDRSCDIFGNGWPKG